ncbi:HlyD family efflux transporter periplasmic adaptor subunit [Gaetbulibacter sp. M240]|uniref:HlyD family secretion protein n=1 Tax=Gaetbulibacter sp. M240 TaxID=3126511 RepID=UPI00374EFE3F
MNEELNIYSEEVKDVLADPPKAIFRWGNTLLLVFIGIIIFLSWLIKYPDIVVGQAMLTTEIPPQKEFARVTGKIDSLFVENYQEVNKNTPLALIENTAKYKDVIYLKSILDTLNVNQSSFNFPLEQMPMLFLGEIENQFSLFENSYVQYQLNKESNAYLNNNLTNSYTLSQLEYRLQNSINQKEINEEELIYKRKDLERIEKLFKKGVVSAQEYENKKLEFLQAERGLKNISLAISQIKENISNTNNLKQQTTITNTREEINLLKAVIQSFDQLKSSIKEWELKYLFKSNIDGRVSFIKIWNNNQTINSGDFVFTIIPKNCGAYICKVQAPILNSGKIEIGQDVNIKLSGYPDNEYGVLKGKVQDISLIPNNEGLYLINVSLPINLITTYKKEIEFKQEMRGSAEIVTEDLRLIERLFYQFKELFKQNNK